MSNGLDASKNAIGWLGSKKLQPSHTTSVLKQLQSYSPFDGFLTGTDCRIVAHDILRTGPYVSLIIDPFFFSHLGRILPS